MKKIIFCFAGAMVLNAGVFDVGYIKRSDNGQFYVGIKDFAKKDEPNVSYEIEGYLGQNASFYSNYAKVSALIGMSKYFEHSLFGSSYSILGGGEMQFVSPSTTSNFKAIKLSFTSHNYYKDTIYFDYGVSAKKYVGLDNLSYSFDKFAVEANAGVGYLTQTNFSIGAKVSYTNDVLGKGTAFGVNLSYYFKN